MWRMRTRHADGVSLGNPGAVYLAESIVAREIRRKDAITNRIINELFTGMYIMPNSPIEIRG